MNNDGNVATQRDLNEIGSGEVLSNRHSFWNISISNFQVVKLKSRIFLHNQNMILAKCFCAIDTLTKSSFALFVVKILC